MKPEAIQYNFSTGFKSINKQEWVSPTYKKEFGDHILIGKLPDICR
jgi:hypothetical protein